MSSETGKILDMISDPVLIINRSRTIEQANRAFLDLQLRTGAEVVGNTCYSVNQGRDTPCPSRDHMCPHEKVFSHGEAIETTRIIPDARGHQRIFHVTAYPIHNKEGDIQKVMKVFRNVTETMAAFDRAASAEDFLQYVLEGIGEGVVLISKDLKIIKANSRYCTMTGRSPDEIRGEHCYFASHRYDRPCFEVGEDCPVIKSFRNGVRTSTMHIHHDAKGLPYYVEINAFPLKNDLGEITSVIETVNNITKHIELKEQLINYESRYRELYNNIPEMLLSLNDTGTILECNRTLLEKLNASRNWIIGKNITDILSQESRDLFLSKKEQCEDALLCSIEVDLLTTKGALLPVELTGKVSFGDTRKTLNLVARDLTDIKRSENEKKVLEAQLLQAQKMESIGTLSAGIAHDFNNILTGLIGYIELLDKETSSGLSKNYLSKSKELLNVASNLTRQLLVIGRKAESEYHPFELNEFMQQFHNTIRRMIEENIEIMLSLSNDPLYIFGDVPQIYQIFMNLMVNARDAMPDGGSITVTTRKISHNAASPLYYHHSGSADLAQITIRDTGTGIPGEIQKRIFDPFFTTKDVGSQKGTGLGLSIVYSVVKSHKGWVDVSSTEGNGAEFTIYLPLTDKRPAMDDHEPADSPSATVRGCVLIVDDEDIILDVVSTSLEQLGCKVVSSLDPDDALKLFRDTQESFDLVIIDKVMPGMSGVDLFLEMKKISPSLKAVLASGYFDEDQEELRKLGFSAFLNKPFNLEQLSRTVSRFLG